MQWERHRATCLEAVRLQQRAAEIRYAQRALREVLSTQLALAFEAIERATAVLRLTRITRPSSPGHARPADAGDGAPKPPDVTSAKSVVAGSTVNPSTDVAVGKG